MQRRTQSILALGANVAAGAVQFRVWSPKARRIRVVFDDPAKLPPLDLEPAENGYFAGSSPKARAGMTYRFQVDGIGALWPDPVSRFQPAGPTGPSQIVDPGCFPWRDGSWGGVAVTGQALYEMHVGTFTPEGTWQAAMSHLPGLADLGVTVIELMPIADFPGNFGWSYDVANQFAPTRLYGTPDDARRFVDEAHRVGIGVILDVVYNHFGRVGEEILRPLSDGYFSTRHQNEWGAAVNFDDENSKPVRDFFKVNVERWIREYHFDGLRIDATQAFEDESSPHILLELARAARQAAPERRVLVVGENEPQRARLFRSGEEGGYEFDALWNDDFRHAAHVRLTGSDEGYCTDYHGSAEEFVAAAKWGFLYQGQRYSWQSNPRGTPALEIAAPRFINYLENHDQVANSLRGARLRELTSPGRLRAMTALLLLAPQTPLLFQGQEFASSVPFLYFNDCSGEEARGVAAGRAKFLSQFPSLATCEAQAQLINPADAAAFERSKLDHRQRVQHGAIYALHRDLLHLRRDDPVFRRCDASLLHGASLGDDALVLRFFDSLGDTRLFVLNFGCQLRLNSIPQPLVAPPENRRWALLWSSEDVRYGGNGTPQVDTPDGWRIPGESALVLEPNPIEASS